MQEKYKKYYDVLSNSSYASHPSKYKSYMDSVTTKMGLLQGTVSSTRWTEKGIEILKNSAIPAIKKQASAISDAVSIIEKACSKATSLVSQLKQLDAECKSLEDAKNEKSKYTDKETGEVNSHYYSNITYYEGRVKDCEKACDRIIDEINGLSLNVEIESSHFSAVMSDLKESVSLEAKKWEWLGTVNDGNWWIDPAYAHKAKELEFFDNTTGKILKEGDILNLKKGETRILTVKVPRNAGTVKQVIRTSAGGNSAFLAGHVVTARSDINPDPNIVDYVNYKPWSRHVPVGVNLKTNYYDWIITATEEGSVQISQTCEYKVEEQGGTPKAMADIRVNVSA